MRGEGDNDVRSAKYEEARSQLPDHLRAEFDKLVEEYKGVALLRHGAPFVSYVVLADLIQMGWRKIEDGDGGGKEPG